MSDNQLISLISNNFLFLRIESHGQNRVSTLERCFAHSDALIEALVEQEIPAAALCDSSWLISSDPMGEPPKSPESDAMKLT